MSEPLTEAYRLCDTPDRRVIVFDNGLTAIIQRHVAAPIAAIRVYVRAGSVFEGGWQGTGISHLFEHVVTGGGTRGATEQELIELGDRIGGLVNAYTSVDHICHFVTTTPEHVAPAVGMFAEYVKCPLLSTEVFDREIGVVQRELERDRHDPDTQLEEMLHDVIYRGHPMQYPVIGHRAGLCSLTADDLRAFDRQVHAPDNVFAVVVGAVDLDETTRTVADAFSGLERRPRLDVRLHEPSPPVAGARAVREMDVESAAMAISWLTVREGVADDAALDLLASVLGEGETARLVSELRWSEGLVFSITASHDSSWHTPGIFQVSAQCDADRIDDVRRRVREIIQGLGESPIREEELNRAKRQLLVHLEFQRETAEGLASQLGEDFLATGNLGYSQAYEQRVREITVADLHRVTASYLKTDTDVVAAVIPKRSAGDAGDVRMVDQTSPASCHQLSNGMACILHPMPNSGFVAVSAGFLGGLLAETEETNGVFTLMAQALTRGTLRRSGEQIANAFLERGSHLRVGSGLNQFGCSYLARAEDHPFLMEVMAEVLCEPAFEEGQVEKVKPALRDLIARIDEDWHPELTRYARQSFFEHSPYRRGRLGTIANLDRFGSNDLKRVHADFLCAANGVVAIAGGIEEAGALAAAEQCFGRLAAGGQCCPEAPVEGPHTQDRLFVKRSAEDREVAGLFMAYPGLCVSDIQPRAAVTVLEAMLAGYALCGGRFYTALRGGDQDMVYEVSSSGIMGVFPGFIAFSAGCEPRRVGDVYQTMRSEIDKVRSGHFTLEELDRARNMVVMGELDQLQGPADFAGRLATDHLFGLETEDWAHFLDEIRLVTKEAVVSAASTYLEHVTIAVVTPEPDLVNIDVSPRVTAG